MKKPLFITFTGIDDRTDFKRASQLADKYPIEWGMLISLTNKDTRYPSKQTISEFNSVNGSRAFHFCDDVAKATRGGYDELADLVLPDNRHILEMMRWIDRLQVNGKVKSEAALLDLYEVFGVKIITQTTNDVFDGKEDPLFQLYDCSGGTGKFPDKVPPLVPDKLVGYAGGITPDNVLQYLEMIQGEGEFWIDVETGVRTDGWFDLDKVEEVCRLVYGDTHGKSGF